MIYRYDLTDKSSRALTSAGYLEPSYSPDGKYIAATKQSTIGTDVVILDGRSGSELMQVTKVERQGDNLVLKGKVFGTMPMAATLTPKEARAFRKLLTPRLVWFRLTLPFRKSEGLALDEALDAVRERFGSKAVTRAVQLGKDEGFAMPTLPDSHR